MVQRRAAGCGFAASTAGQKQAFCSLLESGRGLYFVLHVTWNLCRHTFDCLFPNRHLSNFIILSLGVEVRHVVLSLEALDQHHNILNENENVQRSVLACAGLPHKHTANSLTFLMVPNSRLHVYSCIRLFLLINHHRKESNQLQGNFNKNTSTVTHNGPQSPLLCISQSTGGQTMAPRPDPTRQPF